jgi:acyl-coenzyme A synthetase/AMP-(fatty) acid ligase
VAIEDCGVAAIDCVNGIDRLGVCVVARAPGDAEAIRSALARFDPDFDVVRFVASIPRTALGKPVRTRLWQLLRAPAEQADLPAPGTDLGSSWKG